MAKETQMGKQELLLNSSSWLKNTSNKENKGRKVERGLIYKIFGILGRLYF